MPVRVRAFRDQPAGIFLDAGFLEQHGQQHSRPFTCTDSSMYLLNNKRALGQRGGIRYLKALHHGFVMRHAAISSALYKMDPRYRWEALQFIHRKNQRAVHHAVDHETVLARINVGEARTSARHEVERGWRDNSRRILKRSQSLAHLAGGQTWNNVTGA